MPPKRRTSMSSRIPVWLDCDPGHDDAMAIILCGYNPTVELLGISTVASNQTVEKVTQNALDVLSAAGLAGIDVIAGQAKPLLRPSPLLCPEIHGDSGLDGPSGGRLLPLSGRSALQGKAVPVMFEAIQSHARDGGRVRLVCTGALTNAALLLLLYPEVLPMVEVVIMGGAMGIGNTGPVQEFNIQVDPEAAKVVFESGVRLTMVPLEVTHTALATPEVLRWIAGGGPPAASSASEPSSGSGATSLAPTATSSGAVPDADLAAKEGGEIAEGASSAFRRSVVQLLLFFADTYRREFEFPHPPLHDPCAVAFVIAPEIFKVREMRVDIEVCSELSAGQTVCDRWGNSPRPKNCCVALQMDVAAFWRLMVDAVEQADKASALNVPPAIEGLP